MSHQPDISRWKNKLPIIRYKSLGADEKTNTTPLYGFWNVIYAWPPKGTLLSQPEQICLDSASVLETFIFTCQCKKDIELMRPVKVWQSITSKGQVQLCQIVEKESEVLPGLARNKCPCHNIVLAPKMVLYPVNDSYVLYYVRHRDLLYDAKMPNHAFLLHRECPSLLEIENAISQLAIWRRPGAPTYCHTND